MKKEFFILMSVLLLSFCFSVHANASEGKTTIKVGEVTAETKTTVDVPISLSNNTGLCGMVLSVSYDNKLVLKGITKGSALNGLYMTKPGDLNSNPVKILWDGMEEDSTNGDIAVLSFACPDQAGTYDISISYVADDIIDGNLNTVEIETVNGAVEVTEAAPHDHSGGEATCSKKAICKICGEEYGELDSSNHQNVEIINQKEPTYEEEGYTGDTYCNDCKKTIKTGEAIPVLKDGPIVRVQNQSVITGKEVVVPVVMENNPGFAGFSFDVNYDENLLELVSVSKGEVLADGSIDTNENTVNWYTSDNVRDDGVILKVTFKALEDVEAQQTEVSITLHDNKPNLVNEAGEYLEMNYFPGTIDIKKGVIGDFNDDQDITIGDVVLLNRHILGRITLDDKLLPFADVNGDGIVSIGDVVVLNRHVLGKETIEEARAFLEMMGDDLGAAGDAPTIYMDSVNVAPEGTVDIPVRIRDNSGIAGIALDFDLPEGYTLDSITKGELLSEGTFSVEGNSFTWYTKENMKEDGVLVTLRVTAGKDAQNGVIGIKAKDDEERNIVDEHSLTVYSELIDGEISIRTATECETNGHIEGDPVHENEKKATCTEEGSYDAVVYCSVCGEEISRRTEIVPAAHTPVIDPAVEATTTSTGLTEGSHCSVCGEVLKKQEVIPRLATKEEKDQKAADDVAGIINEMDPSDPASIEAAKKAYDALTEEQKKLIDPSIVQQLEKAVKEGLVKKVTSIKLTGISKKIAAGKKFKLTATVAPEDATNAKLKWTSSNKKVATVTQKGVVTIKKKTGGKSVKIIATATDGSNKKAVWSIKVMKGAVTKVTIKGGKSTLKAGKTMKLKVSVKKTKGTANTKVKWTSSNTKWATVTQKGVVKAIKAGKGKTVKITAMATDGTNKKSVKKIKIK